MSGDAVKPANTSTTEPKKPKEWHPQQAKLLQSWAEIASSYRWMHNQAYMIYKKQNLRFMLPLIIMSTVTGTANFAQATFPATIRPYVPQIIGAINLVSAIMTTIYQFLKISEFMESHRISSINYGKLARTITVELNLPVKDRNSGGAECVKLSRTEIDRLIEQSPAIPKPVLTNYEQQFAGRGLSEPEIIVINKVDIYEDQENKVATTVAEAGAKLKSLIKKKPLFQLNSSESPTVVRKEKLNKELNALGSSKLVSSIEKTTVANLVARLTGNSPKKKPEPVLPQFPECDDIPESKSPVEIVLNMETDDSVSINADPVDENPDEIVKTIISELVDNTVKTEGGVVDELEELKQTPSIKERGEMLFKK